MPEFLIILLSAILLAVILVFLTSFICFMRVFYFKKRKPLGEDEYEIPKGDIYEVFRDDMINWVKKARSMPYEDFEIESYDGLKLRGRYYEYAKGAPIELMFHGYEGNGERDLSGGIERCFALGRSSLIIDQRASGRSEGHVSTFGIKERRDCRSWIDFAISHFGDDVKLGITGVSMGAATVIMTAGESLPENVKFVLADCGYSSAKEIISKVIDELKLPSKLVYPFVRLGGKIFGGFDLEETSPIQAVKETEIPIIFVHGDTDDFVPFAMSQAMFDACTNEKKALITIPNAGHGLAYPVAREKYIEELRALDLAWNL